MPELLHSGKVNDKDATKKHARPVRVCDAVSEVCGGECGPPIRVRVRVVCGGECGPPHSMPLAFMTTLSKLDCALPVLYPKHNNARGV